MRKSLLLNKSDWEFLIKNLSCALQERLKKFNQEYINDTSSADSDTKILVSLSAEEVSLISDELLDIFSSKGLQVDEEPNTTGLYIERLIDVIDVYEL